MEQRQPLIYSFVARGEVILAQYTEFNGNFTGIAAKCLRKLPASNKRLIYKCDGHTFNYLVHDGFTYCVVALESAGQEIPNAFLGCIKDEFTKGYYSFNKAFGSKLKEQMEYQADHQKEISKLAKVKPLVSDGDRVIRENIEMILDCAEKIKLSVDKNSSLHSQGTITRRMTPREKKMLEKVLIILSAISIIGFYMVLCPLCDKCYCIQ